MKTEGSRLAFCDPKDNVMGIGFDKSVEESKHPEKWGQNKVGKVMEKIREHIIENPTYQTELKQMRKEVADAKKYW